MYHQARCLILLFVILSCGQQPTEFRQIGDREILQLSSSHKLLVLNFWATWCEPCVEEIPLLIRFQKQHESAAVVGISMDERKNEPKVRQFIQQRRMDYQVYLRKGGEDFEAMVNGIDPNWQGGIPATFVFRNGKRVFSKTGQLKAGELDSILESTS